MLFLIIISSVIVLYLWWSSSFSRWRKLNIPHLSPHFLWGNFADAVYMKQTPYQIYEYIYNKFSDNPYVGVYIINKPGLLIRDPELIVSVVQKNFAHFLNNDLLVDERIDPIFGGNPFASRGNYWRKRRIVHNRQFSTGKVAKTQNKRCI